MKNYIYSCYFNFLKKHFFNKHFKPVHISFRDELTFSLLLKIIVIITLIYHQHIFYTLLFISLAILLPDYIFEKMKDSNLFFKYYISHLNYIHKTHDFGFNDEYGYITYQNEILMLESGLYNVKRKTIIVRSNWSVDSCEEQGDTYNINENRNTIVFDHLNTKSLHLLNILINDHLLQKNPAKCILSQIM